MSNSKRKAAHRTAIRERAMRALGNLYHNATPSYPSLPTEELSERFSAWMSDAASFEIDYIRDGGAQGRDYRKILSINAQNKKLLPNAARYYVARGVRAIELERAQYAMWEYITDYGDLYQWGRGGRTLAPDDLIKQRGGSSFSINEGYADEIPMADVVRLIQVVESFNDYVERWNRDVPNQWREMLQEERAQRRYEEHKAKHAAHIESAEREYWACRDVVTA